MNTYTEVLKNKAFGNPIAMIANEYIVAYTTNKALYASRNPLFYDKISAFGYDESLKFKFYDYCSQFFNSKTPDYDEKMDK